MKIWFPGCIGWRRAGLVRLVFYLLADSDGCTLTALIDRHTPYMLTYLGHTLMICCFLDLSQTHFRGLKGLTSTIKANILNRIPKTIFDKWLNTQMFHENLFKFFYTCIFPIPIPSLFKNQNQKCFIQQYFSHLTCCQTYICTSPMES